jgi:outer membrane protein OmpA-like peptidoglycan-associated protein
MHGASKRWSEAQRHCVEFPSERQHDGPDPRQFFDNLLKEDKMSGFNHLLTGAGRRGLVLGLSGMIGMLYMGGCATMSEMFTMQAPEGQQQQVTMPKSTWTGAASGEQANALAKTVVDANNNTMKRFDEVDGRLDKLQETSSQDLQTAQQALAKLEQMANQQGTGEMTLFFKTGSAKLDQFEYQRLVRFLDYISVKSRGRKVIILSIGSASATGSPQFNKKLSTERSEAPLPVINQFLVNVPHEFYKVTGIGDMYAPKNASTDVDKRYQNVRVIAVYDTGNIPQVPEEK